jgi:hypothetical protein
LQYQLRIDRAFLARCKLHALTDHYSMVQTKGTMRLEKIKDQPIDLAHDATYIVFIEDGKPQIVFVLSHEDPMKMAQDQQAWSTRVKVHGTRRLNKDDGVVAGPRRGACYEIRQTSARMQAAVDALSLRTIRFRRLCAGVHRGTAC